MLGSECVKFVSGVRSQLHPWRAAIAAVNAQIDAHAIMSDVVSCNGSPMVAPNRHRSRGVC